jgi:ABC-type uncharacterized transport system permease subunit
MTRVLSVAPSPAFWIAVIAYAAAAAVLFVVVAGNARWRALALALVAVAFVANGADIAWRGVEHVHPAQSVREALGFLAWILTGGYLLASARYRLALGGVVVMPVALVMLLVARLTPAGVEPEDLSVLGRIHISLATIGVGLFALASALSAIYLFENRALKQKRFDTAAFKDGGAPIERSIGSATRSCGSGFRSSRSRWCSARSGSRDEARTSIAPSIRSPR